MSEVILLFELIQIIWLNINEDNIVNIKDSRHNKIIKLINIERDLKLSLFIIGMNIDVKTAANIALNNKVNLKPIVVNRELLVPKLEI